MRYFWLWVTVALFSVPCLSQGNSGWAHYAPPEEVPIPSPDPPHCDAGRNIAISCKNHHIGVGLTASGSQHYTSVLWSVKHLGVSLSKTTSVTPLLKVLPSASMCDTKFKVKLMVHGKDGQHDSCYVEVSVSDHSAPTFTGVVSDIEVECDDVPSAPYVSAKDDCDKTVKVEFSESESGGKNKQVIFREWVAIDSCGNSNRLTQRVVVFDKDPPQLVGVEEDTEASCDAIPTACVVVAYDDCDENIDVTYSEDTVFGNCHDTYSLIRTWSALDSAYNAASKSQTVFVYDTEGPVLLGLPDKFTASCDDIPDIEDAGVTADDNCDDDITVKTSEIKRSGSCPHDYVLSWHWAAQDDCGNRADDTITVNVKGSDPEIQSVKSTEYVPCGTDLPVCEPAYSDPCDYNVELIYHQTTSEMTCWDEYTIYRSWSITNVCGNAQTTTQTVYVTDDEAPRFTTHPLGNRTVSCNNIPSYAVTAVDDCDEDVNVDYEAEQSPPIEDLGYFIWRTWVAEDNCGHMVSASQTLTVIDTTPPVLVGVPPHMTVECDSPIAQLALSPSAELVIVHEECPCVLPQTELDIEKINGTCSDCYEIIRTWSAFDCSGNADVAHQTITVCDTVPPILVSKVGTESHDYSVMDDFLHWDDATCEDNCATDASINVPMDLHIPGTCAHTFTIVKGYTCADSCGNVAEKYYTINIHDKVPPVFVNIPPSSQTWECDDVRLMQAGDTNYSDFLTGDGINITDNAVGGVYDLPQIFFKKEIVDGTCEDSYTILLTWWAVDICDNSVEAVVTIHVVDYTPPLIYKPRVKIVTDDCNIPPAADEVFVSDNCADVTVEFSEIRDYATECPSEYRLYREWSVIDDCGNGPPPVHQTVYIEDNGDPVWVIPPPSDATIDCEYHADYTVEPIANDDNCHDNYTHLTTTLIEETFDVRCDHDYKVARKWSVQDCVGNFAFAVQTITVVDDTPPTIMGETPNETVDCIHGSPPEVTAVDNCGYEISIDYSEDFSHDCAKQYVVYRRWVAKDFCGNTDYAVQTIHVKDQEFPVISAPGDCVASCDEELAPNDASCTDDCSYVTLSSHSEKIDGECPHNYRVKRTWTCTDDCGKGVSHVQTVHVRDLDPPIFDQNIPGDVTAECDDLPPVPTIGGGDNCGYPMTDVYDSKEHNIYDNVWCKYQIYRKWTLSDTCGNSVIYTQTIFVDDHTPPVIYGVPEDTTVECNEVMSHHNDNTYAIDNCDWNPEWQRAKNKTVGDCDSTYSLCFTYTATDHCGNVAVAKRCLHVEDHQKPIFVPFTPSFHYTEIIINENNFDILHPPPGAIDSCQLIIEASCTTTKEPGCTDDDYTLTRVCVAHDDCGNGGYPISQIVEVEDRTPCIFLSRPAHDTLGCKDEVTIVDITHDCDFATFSQAIVPGSCDDEHSIYNTWTITDDCGNSAIYTQTIEVIDDSPPVVVLGADVNEECAHDLVTFLNVSDDCDYNVPQIYKDRQIYYVSQHNYKLVQEWYIKDRCGNGQHLSRTVTVKDETAPWLSTLPPNETVDHLNIPLYPDYVPCEDNCPLQYVNQEFTEDKVQGTCRDEYDLYRTWCCTDSVGGQACATQTVHVEDRTPPTFYSCPPDMTTMNTPPAATLEAGDGYGGKADITFSQTNSYDNYMFSQVYIRTWTAQDYCGNIDVCVQHISITEPAPILCVPDNATLDCTEIDSIPSVGFVTDQIQGCSDEGINITFVEEYSTKGTCDEEYCVVRKWTAIDDLKGSVKHATEYATSQTICFRDTHGPTWDFEAYRTIDCTKQSLLPEYLDIHPIIAVDDCDDNVDPVSSNWHSAGDYGYYMDYTATDNCGHSVNDRMQIVVVDMEDPVLSEYPPDTTEECNLPPRPQTAITATDNCGLPILTTWQQILEQPCAHRMKVVRGWRAVDPKGNEVVHQQTISVIDNDAPTWAGPMPQDTTLECDQELPEVSVPIANDNCEYLGYVTYLGETHTSPPHVTYATEILTILRKWIVYDDCGHYLQHTQKIVIYDTEYPTLIGIPASSTAQCDACLCASVIATDNCGSPSMHSWNVTKQGTCITEKTVITWWEAVDDVGHSVHDSHTLHIQDSNPPEFSQIYIQDLTADCHAVPIPPTTVIATDDCDPHVEVIFKEELIKSAYMINAEAFAMFSQAQGDLVDGSVEYNLHRTWSATDSCGHHIFKTQTISVNDYSPPTFNNYPSHRTVQCDSVPYFDKDSCLAEDNCAGHPFVSYTKDVEAATCDNEYIIIHTWTATDNKKNEAVHVLSVTVIDTVQPVFGEVPIAKLYVSCEDWNPDNYFVVTATDNCNDVTVSYEQNNTQSTCEDSGRWFREWVATDVCGNTASYKQIIIVSDNEAPHCVECPGAYYAIDCNDTQPTIPVSFVDNCDHSILTDFVFEESPGCFENNGTMVYIWTAEDNCGNSATATATVTATDTTPPTFEAIPEDTTFECSPDAAKFDLASWKATLMVQDDCSFFNTDSSHVVLPGTCKYDTIHVYTWYAHDNCGNKAVAYSTISTSDNTPPYLTGVPSSKTTDCTDTEPPFSVIARDDCDYLIGYPEADRVEKPGSCEESWTVTWEWTASDSCGNTFTNSTSWKFEDSTPPSLSEHHLHGIYPCDELPVMPTLTATDNCAHYPTVHYWSEGEASYEISSYNQTHHWTSADNCGNEVEKILEITIQDYDPPYFATLPSSQQVSCKDIPAVPTLICKDNCDPHPDIIFTETSTPGTCPHDYTLSRTWVCVDNEGRNAFAHQDIQVADTGLPVWGYEAPKDMTLECDDVVPHFPVTATDECDYGLTIDFNFSPGNDKCHNVSESEWIATDSCGHSITTSVSVTITDSVPPTLSEYPKSVTYPCDQLNVYDGAGTSYWPGVITASDNCDYVEDVKFSHDREYGTCEDEYEIILHWHASDHCGNDVNHKMTVHVFDDVPPSFDNMPTTYTVSAYAPLDSLQYTIDYADASDSCDQLVEVTGLETQHMRQYNRNCDNEYLLVRTYVATDNCGNTDTYTYSVSVIDDMAPTLPEVDDITVECDEYDGSYQDCEMIPTSRGDENLVPIITSNIVQIESGYYVRKKWTVCDCADQCVSTSQEILVLDLTPPVFTRTPADTTVECSCDSLPGVPDIKAHDNCDEVSVSYEESSEDGTCENEYTIYRSWVATDSAGNQVYHDATVTVEDNEAPVFCAAGDDPVEYLAVECDENSSPTEPLVSDGCDESVSLDGPNPETLESLCTNSYTVVHTWTAYDDCGNEADYEVTTQVVDSNPPELDANNELCLFPSYGAKWGSWAQYDLSDLFTNYDNCDSESTSPQDYSCNITDSLDQNGSPPDADCEIKKFGAIDYLYVRIKANGAGVSATAAGRTYHVYATLIDDCENSNNVKRDIWIAPDEYIFEHRQPCDSGHPVFRQNKPSLV